MFVCVFTSWHTYQSGSKEHALHSTTTQVALKALQRKQKIRMKEAVAMREKQRVKLCKHTCSNML